VSDSIQMQILNSYLGYKAGETLTIDVNQTLGSSQLTSTGPTAITATIDGPQFKLDPADIAGVYPAPGSEESPNNYLPHIALSRRTLPWERFGPVDKTDLTTPWLALLLFAEGELPNAPGSPTTPPGPLRSTTVGELANHDPQTYDRLKNTLQLADDTALSVIDVPFALLDVLPKREELPLLCHVKQTQASSAAQPDPRKPVDPNASPPVDEVAIVVGNRLPRKGPVVHTAYLVSLEQRSDLYTRSNDGKPIAIPVLHHWSFTPSSQGDFRQVIEAIRFQPKGGVLRFGSLPEPAAAATGQAILGDFAAALDRDGYATPPLDHDQAHKVEFRGPLRPYHPPTRSNEFAVRPDPNEFENAAPDSPLDYSYAAAFEIGRLLALADSGLLEELRRITGSPPERFDDTVAISKIPPVLSRHEWIPDPEISDWWENPWNLATGQRLLKEEPELLATGVGDVTGISEQAAVWRETTITQLQALAAQGQQAVNEIDLNAVTGLVLMRQFAHTAASGGS
jgi:hypothetical protein